MQNLTIIMTEPLLPYWTRFTTARTADFADFLMSKNCGTNTTNELDEVLYSFTKMTSTTRDGWVRGDLRRNTEVCRGPRQRFSGSAPFAQYVESSEKIVAIRRGGAAQDWAIGAPAKPRRTRHLNPPSPEHQRSLSSLDVSQTRR